MANQSKDKTSRRKFLALGLLGGAGLVAGSATAQTPEPATSGETVKMLGPDGKLVEVDKSVLEQSTNRRMAGKKDIQEWVKRE